MLSRRSIRRTGKWKAYIVIILAFFVIADSGPLAENIRPRVLRSRAYRLRIALSKDVKAQLELLGIGTKIDLLSQETLIVTAADGADLIAASSLIKLIDSRQKYGVKVIADYSESDTLPTIQQIADSIGIAGVGSFAEPPAANVDNGIIVDVRDSKVIAVAPVSLLDRVSASVAKLMADSKADDTQLAEDAEQIPHVADETAESKGKTQPQTPQVADARDEAAITDAINELLEADYLAKETPQVADVEPETAVVDKPQPHDFFQAEMFASLAEAETDAKIALNEIAEAETNAKSARNEIAEAERKANEALARAIKAEKMAGEKERLAVEAKAKADLAEIAEAKRQADEALARANKAEEVAREKERLATEALRRATEAEKRAAKAQEAVPPDQPVKKAPPEQPDDAAQKTETPPKTEAVSKAPPKTVAKAEDKTPPAVAPKASTKTKSTVPPPSDDDKIMEMLKQLAAQGTAKQKKAQPAEDKPKTAVVPPVPGTATRTTPPARPAPGTATRTTPPVPPAPGTTTPRIPPGAAKTDKIATETPAKVTAAVQDPEDELELITNPTLPEKIKIVELIELVGKQLKLNYTYDITESKLISAVVFLKLHDGRIKVKDMYALLESVLKSQGYAMMRRGNLVTITKSTNALLFDPDIREGVDDGQLGSMIVTTVFKLKHISTATAWTMLQNMKLGLSHNAIEETKTLMVTGYEYRMPRMEEILKMIDVPGKEPKFRLRKLEYLLPSELAEKVKVLAHELGTISITVSAKPVTKTKTITPARSRTPSRTPTRVPVRAPTPKPKAVGDKSVYLDTDDRTNRVLMIGLAEDLEIVNMLIDNLDVAKYGLMTVKEYTIQRVEAIVILNTFVELGVISSMPNTSTTTRSTAKPARPVEGEPQISVRMTTNSFLVNATPEQHAEIEMLIRFVDVEQKDGLWSVKEYTLQHVEATEILNTLVELGVISSTPGSARTSQRSTLPRPPTVPRTSAKGTPTTSLAARTSNYGTRSVEGEPQISIRLTTNSLIVNATPEQHAEIEMLVRFVDVEQKDGFRSVKEYTLQYVEATEILNTLNELGVIGSTSGSTRTSQYPTYPRTQTYSRTQTSSRAQAMRPPTNYGTQTGQDGPQISIRLNTNSLLVNATPEQHAKIEMLIRFVDVEQKDIRTVQEYEIQYVDISEVVDTLAELGIVKQREPAASSRRTDGYRSESRMPTGARTSTAAAAPVETTTTFEATTGAEIMSEQPQIAVLESTNSLLVYATPKQHDTIALIVAHVDRELTAVSTPYVVYPLENQDPEELAAILSEIVDVTIKTAAKSSPTSKVQANATTTAGIPPKREKDDIQIVADPKTYSIIVYADRKNQQWISALIEELDAYRPQVLLDVTLVEISKTDDFMFDVQNALKMAGGATFDVLSGISVDGTPITSPLLDPFPGSSIAEGVVKGGKAWAFFGDKHVQGLLQAIQTKSYGRILARPTLLVDDNQEGTLDSQQTTYITRTSTITNPGSISGTSTTSTNIIFEAYEAGISLAIKPHISKGDNLRLEITLKQSIFDSDQLGGDKPPDTFTNDVVTVVTIPDNSTIILGGLERIQQGKGGTKVPLLGDIPFIGGLFRSTNNTSSVRKLYIFVKGRIMRPGTDLTSQDLIDISKKSRREFEAKEKEMQDYQDWPGIKPKPMDPLHILEDDEYIHELKNGLHKDEAAHVEMELDFSGKTNGSY